jgi:type VI secretion system secreted protein VgrG
MSQENRLIAVETPLLDKLKLRSISGHSEVSRLFRFDLEMVCTSGEISHSELINKLVGKKHSITVRIDLDDGKRFLNGHISRVKSDFSADGGTIYRAEMVPTFWFASKTSDCRIFQDMKVTEIIEKVLGETGVSLDIKWKVGDYPKLEYCVQYRETDFNFVSRLLEENGLFYYFVHSNGSHKMVIGQDTTAFEKLKPESTIHYPESEQSQRHIYDHITDWQREFSFVTGKWAHTDYNFKDPGAKLLSKDQTAIKLSETKDFELYDYPGEYVDGAEGKRRIAVRMEEEEVGYDNVHGTSTCRTFDPGYHFDVGKHPSQNERGGKWVLTSVNLRATNPSPYTTNSGGSSSGSQYANSFVCIPDGVKFRPERLTPKPVVTGVQTAIVVGPSGEEIHTDEYGRIKVQFHWDRYGKKNENSSCWIRCAQNIAGKNWGLMAIPRIGQEVVIEFLEGDPDRPLVTGCVYNEQQMPAYNPKEMASRIYLKTNSTKGGKGFNELMFEDKKDKEMIFMHAQKDMDVRVLEESRERIIGSRHQIIGNKDKKKGSQYELVYEHKELNIKQHQQEHVEGNYSLMIGNGETAGGTLSAVVENKIAASVGSKGMEFKNDGESKVEVKGKSSLTVKGDSMEKLGSLNSTIKGNHSEKCENYSNKVGQMVNVKAGMKIAYEAGTEVHIKSGASMCLESGATLTLKVGGNFININPAGIFIQGTIVGINSGGAATPGTGCMPLPPVPPTPITSPPDKAKPTEPDMAHDDKSGQPSNA